MGKKIVEDFLIYIYIYIFFFLGGGGGGSRSKLIKKLREIHVLNYLVIIVGVYSHDI